MTKKTEKTDVEKLNKKALRAEARELGIDSDVVLDYLEEDDLSGLKKLIEKTEKIAAEQAAIDDLVRTSKKLDKKSLHLLGVALKGCTDEGFYFYDDSDHGWLRNILFQIFSPEFKEFLNADKTLANVEKFVTFLEKKKK
ncbi:MAG: hypothetical protein LWW94_09915 [Candidatus Desulfofervidaceae bacterium]|nr:hypothetical protein [Candidatus Desulfofervidaceae bacterium]